MISPWRRQPHGFLVDQILDDALEACEKTGASRRLIWGRLNALMAFWEKDFDADGNFLVSTDLSIPLKIPPPFKLVYPALIQLRLPLELSPVATPRQARRSRSRPMVRTCRSCERTWTQQELFPVPAEVAAMVAALAVGFTTWSREEAS